MIDFLNNSSTYATLQNSIKPHEKLTVFGCDLDAKLTILCDTGKFLLLPVEDVKDAVLIKEKLNECGFRVEMLCEKLNYNLNPFDNEYNEKVLKILNDLLLGQVDALIINPMFLYYKLPNIDWLKSKILSVKKGEVIDLNEFVSRLVGAGFERVEFPEKEGQFRVKGDLVEVFSSKPYRIYFDFDTIESIREYDETSLLNKDEVPELVIGNCCWIENSENVLNKVSDDVKSELEQFGSKLNNMLWCAPFCDYLNGNIFDYLPEDAVVSFLDTKLCYNYLEAEIKEYNKFMSTNKYHKNMSIKNEGIICDNAMVGFQYITNSNRIFNSTRVFNIKTVPVSNYRGLNKIFVNDMQNFVAKKYTVVLYAKTKDNVTRLTNLFGVNRMFCNVVSAGNYVQQGQINILPKRYGMSVNLEVEKTIVVSNLNMFGALKPLVSAKQQKNETMEFLPQSGDFVVHNTYGIGKCVGIERLQLSSSARDYIIVEYKNSDKLYLPVENIDSLQKFVGDSNPTLNKLGSTEFLKTKEKVRANVKNVAFDLVKLYRERECKKGYTYPNDDEIIKQFEESFGYEETADQVQAVLDIKTDMMNGKIMDRLICGDVGFGKTEVALRGAFKTIMAGRQVAFLCPTTILSQQHYNTCLYRMKPFGVNVAVLNRFCSTSRVKEILDGIKSGEIDMVVGTHKLLGKNVDFKNLGLLILDEEQKFGVGDKEKLKELKKQVNVITLSATPIPRTLNLALMGVRDISVIETPPVSRIPTLVKVSEYSDTLLSSVVGQELERDGQVLIVYNHVETIFDFAGKVKNMFPNVSVGVAHGQMEQQRLEDAIFKLYNGETQILVSTTLIENGIDLPNANTLFVIDADMLGLSQLYQLKGRVGRSDRQAYAYFTYNGNKMLNDTAYKRLEAISEYTAMGSGYKIALRDLEIRGAGRIFGAEQHGHIEKVGYAMYLKLLSEAVGELKGEKILPTRDVRIETTLNAFLPYDYIERHDVRMSTYLKIGKISSMEEFTKIIAEFNEIYGFVPDEVANLCKIALIKNLASVCQIQRVVLKNTACQIVFYDDANLNQITKALESFSEFLVLEVSKQPIINIKKVVALEKSLNLILNFLEILKN